MNKKGSSRGRPPSIPSSPRRKSGANVFQTVQKFAASPVKKVAKVLKSPSSLSSPGIMVRSSSSLRSPTTSTGSSRRKFDIEDLMKEDFFINLDDDDDDAAHNSGRRTSKRDAEELAKEFNRVLDDLDDV
jgi:hypothetical protein